MSHRALVVPLLILLAACGAPGGGPAGTESAVRTTSAAAASPPASPAIGRLSGNPRAVLRPGTYRSSDPPVEFTIPATSDGDHWYGVQGARDWQVRKGSEPCDGCEVGHIHVLRVTGDVDATVAEWMALENSSFEEPQPVELGGAGGVEFTGSVPEALNVAIVHGGYNPHGRVHVYVLDVSGETVVVVINEYSESDPFFADAEQVVETFEFAD